jgi:toxin ParE1/3/4
MGRIQQTLQAQADLTDIWQYIGRNDEAAADRLLEMIDQKLILLSDSPYLGKERFDLCAELRSFAVKSYLIFYRPLNDGIEVIRVLHGARDIENLF